MVQEIFAHNGYFVDQIPSCFSTESLALAFDDLLFYPKLAKSFNIKNIKTYPIELSVYKESFLRRTLSFPNILAYIKLLQELANTFNEYEHLISSPNSESKANILTTFDYNSNYRKSIMERNRKFCGNKYKLSIDISNCYSSIYSHSIIWAMLGKDKAKNMALGKEEKNTLYTKFEKIDRYNARLKYSETNGLVIGPYSSRIISEIILGAIDKILSDKKYEFSRFVDDYNFYFTSKYDAERAIGEIASILNQFNLKINESKIKIEKYPFDILDDYSNYFKQSLNNKYPIYDILQKASLLEQQGKKGSYKYAFKMLKQDVKLRGVDYEEVLNLFYTLISIIVNRPMMARYAVEMISSFGISFSKNEMVDKLNELLAKEIDEHHDQEVLWLLYVILKYGAKITCENVCAILNKSNDFAKMMILDMLNGHRKLILNYTENSSKFNNRIKKEVMNLDKELNGENLLTKRWFLIYEINIYNFNMYGAFKNLKLKDNTYSVLKKSNVNFYKSIFD